MVSKLVTLGLVFMSFLLASARAADGPRGTVAGDWKAPLSPRPVTSIMDGTATVTETRTATVTIMRRPVPTVADPGRNGTCAGYEYDPEQYVCHVDVLCPIVSGEALSACGKACYSKFMYTCNNTRLHLLPTLKQGQMVLYASNPKSPALHNQPVTACDHEWRIGGQTCSSCPKQVDNLRDCPSGNVTAMNALDGRGMAVTVPGGQPFFLTQDWTIGVSAPHSASLPPGAETTGFTAFGGGGFYYEVGKAYGWFACKAADAIGGQGYGAYYTLNGQNATNGDELVRRGCVPVNLRVEKFEGMGAWEYD